MLSVCLSSGVGFSGKCRCPGECRRFLVLRRFRFLRSRDGSFFGFSGFSLGSSLLFRCFSFCLGRISGD